MNKSAIPAVVRSIKRKLRRLDYMELTVTNIVNAYEALNQIDEELSDLHSYVTFRNSNRSTFKNK